MHTEISFDTLFALCPTLSYCELFTGNIQTTLLSLNQMHFIMYQFNTLPLPFYFKILSSLQKNDKCTAEWVRNSLSHVASVWNEVRVWVKCSFTFSLQNIHGLNWLLLITFFFFLSSQTSVLICMKKCIVRAARNSTLNS